MKIVGEAEMRMCYDANQRENEAQVQVTRPCEVLGMMGNTLQCHVGLHKNNKSLLRCLYTVYLVISG